MPSPSQPRRSTRGAARAVTPPMARASTPLNETTDDVPVVIPTTPRQTRLATGPTPMPGSIPILAPSATSPSKTMTTNGMVANANQSPLTETAVEDLEQMTQTASASAAIQDAYQRLMQQAQRERRAGEMSNGKAATAKKEKGKTRSGQGRGTSAKSGAGSASQSKSPVDSAAPTEGADPDVPPSASVPVATEHPIPIDALQKQKNGESQPPDLATEILPAPPTSLQDPQYEPLNPDLAGVVPGLAFTLTQQTAPPMAITRPSNSATQGPLPAAATDANGQPTAIQTSTPIPAALSNEKKKKNEPTFSLSSPPWYDGRVPFALYAIVNNRPEAVTSSARSKRRKQRGSMGGKGINGDGRISRASTPSGTVLAAQSDNDDSFTRGQSVASTDAALSEEGFTPPSKTLSLPVVDHDGNIAALEDAGHDSSMDSPGRALSSSADGGEARGGAGEETIDSAVKAEVTPSSFEMKSEADPAATLSHPDEPPEFTMAAESNGSTLVPAVATTTGRGAGQAPAEKRDAPSSADVISQHATPPIDQNDASDLNSSTSHDTNGQDPQAIGGSSQDQHTQGHNSGLASSQPQRTSPDPAASANVQITRDTDMTISRHASPASAAGAGPNGHDIGDESFASTSSLSGMPTRPTRRAAEKVAARGSYYSPAAFVMQAPAQAVQVDQQSTNGLTPNGSRNVSGVAGRNVANTSSNPSRDSSIGRSDVKGKGKAANEPPVPAFEDSQYNNDFCSTCHGSGHFICCDSCPRSFHFACVNPPLDIDEVPLDDDSAWHCQECSAIRHPPAPPKKKDGIFGPLLNHVEKQNPTTFSLTPDIKNYFKGVATATDGTYVDSSRIRQIKVDKKGTIEQRDPFRLRDAKGKEILCHSCGGGALPRDRAEADALATVWSEEDRRRTNKATASSRSKASKTRSGREASATSLPDLTEEEEHTIRDSQAWRRIVSCDFCSLHWHLDCLDPPLANMPSNFRKWKCPCHIDEFLAHTRMPKSSTQLQVVDLPIPTLQNTGYGPKQFYRPRVTNSGEIEIIPDPLDNFTSSSASNMSASRRQPPFGRNIHPGWQNIDIPAADGEIPGGGIRKVRFRVPEKIVRTDWWMKVLQGGRDRLLDVNAPFKYAAQQGAAQGDGDTTGLDFLVQAALADMGGDAISGQDDWQTDATPSEQPEDEPLTPRQLVRLVLNSASPASMRLQPAALHEKPELVSGYVPHEGGKLKREDDEALPESAMRSSLSEERQTGVAGTLTPAAAATVKRPRAIWEARDDKTTLAQPPSAKKPKLSAAEEEEDEVMDDEELRSLRAVRELIRQKGEKELLAFLEK